MYRAHYQIIRAEWKDTTVVVRLINRNLGLQVGQKRGRAELDDLDHETDGTLKKKTRLGWPASQWITCYNKHAPMKQRYRL